MQHGTSITGITSITSKNSNVSHISLSRSSNLSEEITKFLFNEKNNSSNSTNEKINIRLFPNEYANDKFLDLISDRTEYYDDSLLCVFPAKNDGEHGSTIASSLRRAFIVGASTNRGFAAYYTGFSPATLVNAPSTGSEGFYEGTSLKSPLMTSPSSESDNSYNYEFGQTDAAAAEVAGVLALLMESYKNNKKSNLTYRDVMYMLILTSTKNDPTSSKWSKNAANFWFHPNLGFGRINAELLINISASWPNVGLEVKTTSTPITLKDLYSLKISKARENTVWIKVSVDDKVSFIEFISLSFKTKLRTNNNNMKIQILSPSGTLFTVLYPTSTKPFKMLKPYSKSHSLLKFLRKQSSSEEEYYQVGIRSFFGERGFGIWQVGFAYATYIPDDEVSEVSLDIYGLENRPILPKIKKKQASISSIIDDGQHPTIKNARFVNPLHSVKCGPQFYDYGRTSQKKTYSAIFNLIHNEENMTNLDMFLVDPISYRTFPLGRTYETTSGSDIPVSIPCIFKNNASFLLSFRKNYKGLIASTKINVINDMSPISEFFDLFEPYSVQKIKKEIVYSRNDSIETKDQPYFDHFIFSIYSVSDNKEIYSKSFTELASFNFDFELLQSDKHVLTITTPNIDDPCKAILLPFNRFAFREFILKINNDCPNIDGIITQSVKNSIMIVLSALSIFIFVFLIIASILIIIKLIKKRRNNYGELENISISTPMTTPILSSN